MEKMPGHPRLYRRGATYYHRAAIPVDIADTYPKSEETFSLRTKDYQDALKRVRVEAVPPQGGGLPRGRTVNCGGGGSLRVDGRFDMVKADVVLLR